MCVVVALAFGCVVVFALAGAGIGRSRSWTWPSPPLDSLVLSISTQEQLHRLEQELQMAQIESVQNLRRTQALEDSLARARQVLYTRESLRRIQALDEFLARARRAQHSPVGHACV